MLKIPAIPFGTEENRKIRIRAARFSLASATFLCLLKMVTGILSGSIGILASAIDNLADIFMSGVNLMSITKASDPADDAHPYGHGKMETLGTLFQGGVIGLTGVSVALEAARRLMSGAAPEGVSLDVGILVMIFSMAASWFVSDRIRNAGESTGSPALVADSVHFRTDVYSGGGILLSLILFRLTGWKWVDPTVGMVVGAYIMSSAWPLLAGAFRDILDGSLPSDTVRSIERRIESSWPMVKGWSAIRTRRSGSEIQVDFCLVMCRKLLLGEAHRVADSLEREIRLQLGNAHVVSHVDPCEEECENAVECEQIKQIARELYEAEWSGQEIKRR